MTKMCVIRRVDSIDRQRIVDLSFYCMMMMMHINHRHESLSAVVVSSLIFFFFPRFLLLPRYPPFLVVITNLSYISFSSTTKISHIMKPTTGRDFVLFVMAQITLTMTMTTMTTTTTHAFLLPLSNSFSPMPTLSSQVIPSSVALESSRFFDKNEASNNSDASSVTKSTGPGFSNIDMNRYNLPLDQIAQEWTANVVPQSSLREEGIYLGAKSSKEIMVDTVKVSFRRQPSLGVELLEIAGGREDGLGITVINGIVEGGAVEGTDIMMGDSIASISILKTERSTENGMSDIQISTSVETECFGYDKLVAAIVALPPPESENEFIMLTLKRLRRKPKVSITLQYPPAQNEPDTTIELFAGENLRRAMLTRGIKLNDKLSLRFDSGGTGDCGSDGTCATCVVGIVKGDELVSPQGIQEKQILKKNPRWRLACKALVGYGYQEGEMTIRVNPRQW